MTMSLNLSFSRPNERMRDVAIVEAILRRCAAELGAQGYGGTGYANGNTVDGETFNFSFNVMPQT